MKSPTLRIIAGRWRGRRLAFAEIPDLRPTPDRVRETLFNWLAGAIHGSYCLDLFAGSGALGLEALSRGAEQVFFIEKNSNAVNRLQHNLQILGGTGTIVHSSAEQWLTRTTETFNIVFLDPPFKNHSLSTLCRQLEQSRILKDSALIYLESHSQENLRLPDNWCIIKEKQAGQVCYRLAQRRSGVDNAVEQGNQ